jgi:Fe-S oxidoreductase
MKSLALAAVMIAAASFFTWTVRRMLRFIGHGRPDDRLDRLPDRVMSLLTYFLGQKKVVEPVSYDQRPGVTSKHHVWIFWGFLIITIGTGEVFLAGLSGGRLDFAFIGETPYRVLKLVIDWFNLLVLAMVLFAFARRALIRVRLVPLSLDATIILSLIGGLMVSHFLMHSFRFQAEGHSDAWAASWSVSGWLYHRLAVGTEPATAHVISEFGWWIHVFIVLAFLNYIPYSKHIHILTAGPNIFLRNLEQRGAMPLLNLEVEDIEKIGIVQRYSDFTWKSLLDDFSCTECARCSNFCPAYNTDKPLSPMHLIHDLRVETVERGSLEERIAELEAQLGAQPGAHAAGNGHSAGHGNGHGAEAAAPSGPAAELGRLKAELEQMPPLVGGRIKTETLWACTTCGACQEVCPVFIEHPEKIIQMRQNLVMLQEAAPAELARTYKNLERQSNPWGIDNGKRMEWAAGLEVPTLEQNPNAEYLLWIGCMGAFDDRIKKSTRALVEVLKSAQLDFAVLGEREGCSGDPARRSGNEMLYQEEAKANIEALNEAKVRKIITACPHCLHTIKNEYPQLGGRYEVYHHTQILRRLVDEGRIHLEQPAAHTMTFHEPCYLGRWNGEYEAPRALLAATPNPGGLIELDRIRERSFCCGAGGGRMWMEERIGQRVNVDRVDEILQKPVDAVAVACPFCTIMVEDGLKHRNAEERVQVLDVAQVIAKSMVRVYKGHPVPEPPQAEAEEETPSPGA